MRKIGLKQLNLTLILIAVTLLLIFLNYLGALGPVKNIISRLLAPVEQTVYGFGNGINQYIQYLTKEKNVFEENKSLTEEISRLTAENIRLKLLEEENISLKKELSFLEEKNYRYLTARIIGKNQGDQSVVIINKGIVDGIELGLPIIADEGVVVGKIIKVDEHIAFGLLLNSNQSRVAAAILGTEKTSGTIEGEYGLSLKLGLVPRNQELKIDDLIITSGLEDSLPKGLIIGRVSRITTEAHDLFQSAVVKPFLSYDNLDIIAVLKK